MLCRLGVVWRTPNGSSKSLRRIRLLQADRILFNLVVQCGQFCCVTGRENHQKIGPCGKEIPIRHLGLAQPEPFIREEAMYQTGMDMKTHYKETSLGGLALNLIEC